MSFPYLGHGDGAARPGVPLAAAAAVPGAGRRPSPARSVQPERHVPGVPVIEAIVAGLGVVPPASDILLLLKERDGNRVLPIGIGPLEAQAIALPLGGVHPPRPLTHDVFAEVLGRLEVRPRRVEITSLDEGTFHARLFLERAAMIRTPEGDGGMEIDIRPSDAVALAVRTGAPIYVAEAVMGEAAIPAEALATESESAEPTAAESEEPVDESKLTPFRDFLETLDLGDLDGDQPPDSPKPRS